MDEAGNDLLPSAKKSRALMAVLLLSENYEQSRSAIVELLWADRGREQGMASLRQSLNDIRRALGAHRDVLVADRKTLRLKPDCIQTDLETHGQGKDLLPDLETPGPEIKLWLRRQRSLRQTPVVTETTPLFRVRKGPTPLYDDALAHGIANTIYDWCAERVSVQTGDPLVGPEAEADLSKFVIDTWVLEGQSKIAGQTSLSRSADNAQLWSQFETLDIDPVHYLERAGLHHLVNRTVDRTVFDLSVPFRDSEEGQHLQRSTLGAVHLILRNRGNDLELAKHQLEASFEQCNRGIYLAWMAYILTFHAAERRGVDQEALRDEARELVAKALELEPSSAMVLALCSYVSSFLLGSRRAGYELGSQAIEANRSNPLAWIFRGAANFYSGHAHRAYQDIKFARKITGFGPYQYVVDMYACVAATLTNQFEEAIELGEKSSLRSPQFKAPLRYLATLYAAKGDDVNLMRVVAQMRQLEPEFSLESLRDMSYPIPALRHSEALRAIVRDAG